MSEEITITSSRYIQEANGAREAIDILQGDMVDEWEGFDYEGLSVDFSSRPRDHDSHLSPTVAEGLLFGQFVTALHANAKIQLLWMTSLVLDHPTAEATQLLGSVLRNHPSLTDIMFVWCHMSAAYVELMTTSLVMKEHAVKSLGLHKVPLDHPRTVLLANSLLRSNTNIEKLEIVCCGLQSDGCRVILEALNGNTNLRTLNLTGNHISEISLTGARALGNSNLSLLDLRGNPLTNEGVYPLVQGLKANSSLVVLFLGHYERDLSSASFEELLASFNVTLQILRNDNSPINTTWSEENIGNKLSLNVPVRKVHNRLESLNYHLPQLSVWPLALDGINSKPSLLYRFLRQGNLNLFVNHNNQLAEEAHDA